MTLIVLTVPRLCRSLQSRLSGAAPVGACSPSGGKSTFGHPVHPRVNAKAPTKVSARNGTDAKRDDERRVSKTLHAAPTTDADALP